MLIKVKFLTFGLAKEWRWQGFRGFKANEICEIYPIFKDINLVKSIKNEPNFF